MNQDDDPNQQIVRAAHVVSRDPSTITVHMEVTLQHPQSEERLAVRVPDWNRIKRLLEATKLTPPAEVIWYSICFGVAGSALFSTIAIFCATNPPAWMLPTHIAILIGTALLGLILYFHERSRRRQSNSRIDEIRQDIQEVESSLRLRDVDDE